MFLWFLYHVSSRIISYSLLCIYLGYIIIKLIEFWRGCHVNCFLPDVIWKVLGEIEGSSPIFNFEWRWGLCLKSRLGKLGRSAGYTDKAFPLPQLLILNGARNSWGWWTVVSLDYRDRMRRDLAFHGCL